MHINFKYRQNMKKLEQMLKAFLKKRDLLDQDGTKSGGVPHIQLSESLPLQASKDEAYQLDGFYLGGDTVFLLFSDSDGGIICPSYNEAFRMSLYPTWIESLKEILYQAMVQILWEKHYGNINI